MFLFKGINVEEIEQIFAQLDVDRTNTISYLEFLAATIEWRAIVHTEQLYDAFDRLDVDSSGYITLENLREVLGNGYSDEEIQEIIREADTDNDGKVDKDEFIQMMTSDEGFLNRKRTESLRRASLMVENIISSTPTTIQRRESRLHSDHSEMAGHTSQAQGNDRSQTGAKSLYAGGIPFDVPTLFPTNIQVE